MKQLFWFIENLGWAIRCSYNLWLHGAYGLAKVVEKMPFRYVVKYLRKYGATIGENCRFERGVNIHRPTGKVPFEKLIIGDNVYLGHNTLIDLSEEVKIKDNVIIASRCQLWTHASYYSMDGTDNELVYGEHKAPIVIENNAIIYSNVIIIHGVHIGEGARVGANSLVNKNVNRNCLVGGVPARIIES
jgi:acetyltransferase-like isoleucine patch superfamily enzyme